MADTPDLSDWPSFRAHFEEKGIGRMEARRLYEGHMLRRSLGEIRTQANATVLITSIEAAESEIEALRRMLGQLCGLIEPLITRSYGDPAKAR